MKLFSNSQSKQEEERDVKYFVSILSKLFVLFSFFYSDFLFWLKILIRRVGINPTLKRGRDYFAILVPVYVNIDRTSGGRWGHVVTEMAVEIRVPRGGGGRGDEILGRNVLLLLLFF